MTTMTRHLNSFVLPLKIRQVLHETLIPWGKVCRPATRRVFPTAGMGRGVGGLSPLAKNWLIPPTWKNPHPVDFPPTKSVFPVTEVNPPTKKQFSCCNPTKTSF